MTSRALKIVGGVLLLSSLSGCVVYEEHVTLDSKGGVVADIVLNAQALSQVSPEIAEPFVLKTMLGRSCPSSVDMKIEKEGENLHFNFASKKVEDLIQWGQHEQNPLGNASIQVVDGTMDVTRTIGLSKEFEWKSAPGAKMVFKLSAPGTLVSSNSTRQEGNTAVWEVDPNDVLSSKTTAFTARYRVSTPWMTYLLIGMMIAAVGIFIGVMRRKTYVA